jgi:hypothetical protein
MEGQHAQPTGIECLNDPDRPGSNILRVQRFPGALARRQAFLVSLAYCVPMSLFQLRHGTWRDVILLFAVLAPLGFLINFLIARHTRTEIRLSHSEVVIKSVHHRLRDGWRFRPEPERFSPGRWRLAITLPNSEAVGTVTSGLLKEQAEYLAEVLAAAVDRARDAAA